MFRKFMVLLVLLAFAQSAFAAGSKRPFNLVCFEKENLTKLLDTVVNSQQIIANSLKKNLINEHGCDYAQIPKGSKFQPAGVHQTKKGFIFPLFSVTYSTTGLKGYTIDGVFKSQYWKLYNHREYGTGYLSQRIVPKSCDVLDGFVKLSRRNKVPDYVRIPRECRTYTNE